MVVHGGPGIGKTALLDYAVASAKEFDVFRTVGNEAEMELPYAALNASWPRLGATHSHCWSCHKV